MRGNWDNPIRINNGTITFVSEDLVASSTIEELSDGTRNLMIETLKSKGIEYVGGGTLSSTTDSENRINYSITNFQYKTYIEGFNFRMPKAENSPLMELIENSEFRMEGEASIKATTDTISINGVEFTKKQLEALQALVKSSED